MKKTTNNVELQKFQLYFTLDILNTPRYVPLRLEETKIKKYRKLCYKLVSYKSNRNHNDIIAYHIYLKAPLIYLKEKMVSKFGGKLT